MPPHSSRAEGLEDRGEGREVRSFAAFPHHPGYSHGFTSLVPQAWKSAVLRVARVRPWTLAVAAIRESSDDMPYVARNSAACSAMARSTFKIWNWPKDKASVFVGFEAEFAVFRGLAVRQEEVLFVE